MIFHVTRAQKQAGIVILFSDTADVKPKLIKRDKNATTYAGTLHTGKRNNSTGRDNIEKCLCIKCWHI